MSLGALFIFSSCNKEATQSRQILPSGTTEDAGKAKITVVVHAGEFIQAAVDAAAPDTTIKIEPGTYAECIMVNKAGISLVGMGEKKTDVVIKNQAMMKMALWYTMEVMALY